MIISPMKAIEKGWITGLKDPDKQVQPNGIDFTVDRAFDLKQTPFYVSETFKSMRGADELEPTRTYWEPVSQVSWIIPGRDMLDFLSDVRVSLPEGVTAQLVIRSTLARNGLQLVSGLFDSGFKGCIGFLLHNRHHEQAVIAKGTRVGQILFIQADASGTYAGGYNHEAGTVLEYQE